MNEFYLIAYFKKDMKYAAYLVKNGQTYEHKFIERVSTLADLAEDIIKLKKQVPEGIPVATINMVPKTEQTDTTKRLSISSVKNLEQKITNKL